MKHILLYWNHICVLHKQEKIFLEKLTCELRREEIELEVRYFGLGYPEHMSEYLARQDAVLPDMIVSADLEVFEDRRIYAKMKKDLYPVYNWIPLHQDRALEAVKRGEELLPFLAIPLVYYTSNPESCQEKRIHEVKDLYFGGINNSAGKTLVKSMWSRYGKGEAKKLLRKRTAQDMPIGAFQKVRMGDGETALVPSLYAMRADGKTRFYCLPKEGPMLIPSFLCARKTIKEDMARKVTERIFCEELCSFYENNGNLLLYPACAKRVEWYRQDEFFTPEPDWYETVTSEEFYELYGVLLQNNITAAANTQIPPESH